MTTKRFVFKMIIAGSVAFVAMLAAYTYHYDSTYRERNIAYLQHEVGAIIIKYETSFGEVPSSIDAALSKTGSRLEHRGDVDGCGLGYFKINSHEFFLHASGREHGPQDDLLLHCNKGKWDITENEDCLQKIEEYAQESIQEED